ncbi:MAG: hypothetical protein ABI041_20735 [Bdellovibrionia bacterium]
MAQTSSVENLARKTHTGSDIQQKERVIARQVPPPVFVGFALGSMLISASLAIFAQKKEFANFVGLWAPSFLLIGIYNKLTKIEESEESHTMNRAA